jgi:UDP-glucuronate 4-epimerase
LWLAQGKARDNLHLQENHNFSDRAKKHYFITGTAGFIGFHLARRLLQEGHTVTGYDGLTPYYDLSLKDRRHAILGDFSSFTPVIGMLEDKSALSKAVSQGKPDVIVHLAAQAGVRYSLENPKAYVDSNLVGTWNILELAKEHRPDASALRIQLIHLRRE